VNVLLGFAAEHTNTNAKTLKCKKNFAVVTKLYGICSFVDLCEKNYFIFAIRLKYPTRIKD
jgi:hypothetical protein